MWRCYLAWRMNSFATSDYILAFVERSLSSVLTLSLCRLRVTIAESPYLRVAGVQMSLQFGFEIAKISVQFIAQPVDVTDFSAFSIAISHISVDQLRGRGAQIWERTRLFAPDLEFSLWKYAYVHFHRRRTSYPAAARVGLRRKDVRTHWNPLFAWVTNKMNHCTSEIEMCPIERGNQVQQYSYSVR